MPSRPRRSTSYGSGTGIFERVRLILRALIVNAAEILLDEHFQSFFGPLGNLGAYTNLVWRIPGAQLLRNGDEYHAIRERCVKIHCFGSRQNILQPRAAGKFNGFSAFAGFTETTNFRLAETEAY